MSLINHVTQSNTIDPPGPNTAALGTGEKKTAVFENGGKGSHRPTTKKKSYSGLENQRRYWGRRSTEGRYGEATLTVFWAKSRVIYACFRGNGHWGKWVPIQIATGLSYYHCFSPGDFRFHSRTLALCTCTLHSEIYRRGCEPDTSNHLSVT